MDLSDDFPDPAAEAAAIESPCIQICVIHSEARICTGCLRTIDEITAWRGMSAIERADIMAELPSRAARLKVRRGGRKARLARGGRDGAS